MAVKEELKSKFEAVIAWLTGELSSIRTGRATPAILDVVDIEQYGATSKISHVAAISIEDAKTLRIAPWDKGVIKSIESAIQAANLGVSVVVDGEGLRVIFPELTGERRKVLEKLVGEKHEEARIALRRDRESIWNTVVDSEKNGKISEDEKFRTKDEIQKILDEYNSKLEDLVARKLKEIGS